MKRTYQPSNLVRKEDMVLELEWLLELEGNSLREDELKEEKHFQRNFKWSSLKV